MRWNIIVECVGEDGKQSTIRSWRPSASSVWRQPRAGCGCSAEDHREHPQWFNLGDLDREHQEVGGSSRSGVKLRIPTAEDVLKILVNEGH